MTNGEKPGWRDDVERPGIQRYWNGSQWDDGIAPRQKPEPGWKQARVIALGILVAAAVVFTIWRFSQPSAAECENQRADVFFGERTVIDSDCR